MIVNEISLVIQNIKIEFQLYKCQPLDKRNKNERASQHKVGYRLKMDGPSRKDLWYAKSITYYTIPRFLYQSLPCGTRK